MTNAELKETAKTLTLSDSPEEKYRQAFAFMEGWLNIHFKTNSVLTKADRIKLLRSVYSNYGVAPIGKELKESVLNIQIKEATHA